MMVSGQGRTRGGNRGLAAPRPRNSVSQCMMVLKTYQLEPGLAANIREALELAATASKGSRKSKLLGLLRELDETYTKWDEDEDPSAAEPQIMEPFDPFDL